ncbi:DsrE family protein [Simiduia aestuariiviva]|uniref:tRNA 2-thiouridine synthesizing protein C n=1 Tax=Simiduia aestuariiviva TaxID=1510459 RepID=A0A839UKM8_9GAMM|nr:DsrE family protein [Simiduia aestuariiviva]MBB3168193.1 tRNA 2-thiouridine synthesizing protein C [Simiduia aestuariiviva]
MQPITTPKKLLFIFTHAGTTDLRAKEGLDALLAAAAFEQSISVVFMGDGVWTLHSPSNPGALGLPAINKQLPALSLYGIDKLYAISTDISQRHISCALENLCLIDDQQLTALIREASQVLRF